MNIFKITYLYFSLAQCKYSQEISVCGSDASLIWKNSTLTLRSNTNLKSLRLQNLIQQNTPSPKIVQPQEPFQFIETNLTPIAKQPEEILAEKFLNKYKTFELKHPEMPFIFIRGLYNYISQLRDRFQEEVSPFSQSFQENSLDNSNSLNGSIRSLPSSLGRANSTIDLENFEHTRIVQKIIEDIVMSSDKKRWIAVNY